MKEIYLDNAATTKVSEEAAEAALKMMTEFYGNPSSTHTKGRQANAVLKSAREEIAKALGCAADELFFTSCGSESDNWAILSGAESMKRKGRHVITSAAEHDAVRRSFDELERLGYEVTRLSPDESGAIPVSAVENALREDTILVSLMMVNNETGAVTDIGEIAKAMKRAKSQALLHTDAVQGFMKVLFRAKTLGADLISISGHKIHAPKGVGALYIRRGLKLRPYIMGGAQESGYRAGTEAMPQITAFAAAAGAAFFAQSDNIAALDALRRYAIHSIDERLPDAVFIGGGAPHILSVSLPGYRSEVLMNFLENKGIYVSRSSACKKGGRSHVLEAMGLPPRVIDGAIRISFSRYNTHADVDALVKALCEAHQSLHHI